MDPKTFLKKYDELLERYGSQREVARNTGIPRTTIQEWLARREDILFTERPLAPPRIINAPRKGAKRFIFTAAQSESAIHEEFLANLEAYAEHLGAEIHIAGFTYEKRLYEENRKDVEYAFYPSRILPYMTNDRFFIGDDLVFCGNMNTLPTAQEPLAGFEVYTSGRDGIFPHAKVQLVSVPTMKGEHPKIIMTTGAITKRNYIQRRAGILAEFHHIIGAVIVEIDSDGQHFCRHLIAEEETGNFQDLDIYVSEGNVEYGFRVEAITWGDIHLENMDWETARVSWGIDYTLEEVADDAMIDVLEPKFQFLHDTIDFKNRNHHNYPNDPHFRFKMWYNEDESIAEAFFEVGHFLNATSRPFCTTIIIESNHDKAADKWLKNADWKIDPANAEFYLEAQLAKLRSIQNGTEFSVMEWALQKMHPITMENVQYLREDESFTICDGKIECCVHGHLGANGAKGSPKAFSRMGRRANTGHTHSAGILDGIYTAGVTGSLDMGYNTGLSSWSHSDIVTYMNGKRTIITKRNGKFRA